MRQEDLVDGVTVNAIIYSPGSLHLGAFPGLLLGANHQFDAGPLIGIILAPKMLPKV